MFSWSQVVLAWKQEGTVKSPGVNVDVKEERERTSKEFTIKSSRLRVDAKEERQRTSQSCKNQCSKLES